MDRVLFAPRELPPLPPDVAQDGAGYGSWVRNREAERTRGAGAEPNHVLALIMLVGDALPIGADRTLRSLSQQIRCRWTLTITGTPASLEHAQVLVRTCLPRRLRKRVRSVATTPDVPMREQLATALAANHGFAVAFIFPGDTWAPDAVTSLCRPLSADSVVYADEDFLSASGGHHAPRFKPDFSPDFLLSSAYLGRPWAMGSAVALRLPGLVSDDLAALEHECAIAACDVAGAVHHVAEVLCHRSEAADEEQSVAGIAHVEAALRRRGDRAAVSPGRVPGTYEVIRPRPEQVTVSILVPFRDEPRLLRACIDSVTATTASLEVELVLIDNGSTDPETHSLMDRLDQRDDVRIVSDPRPFNWAQLNNTAADVAQGEVLLFLNNDIEAIRENWLLALVGHALRPDVGVVGARLLYPDRRLQHCGVVVGLIGAAGHPLVGLPDGEAGYLNMALATRECSAVTGACMATRRDVYSLLSGFDEALGVDLNDVDFCLRALQAGYRVVYEPAAELLHYESPSRGTAGGTADIQRFIERWMDYIVRGDPYFSTHLTRSNPSCELASSNEGNRWHQWHSSLVPG